MKPPPTRRALSARARRLGVLVDYGPHEAGITAHASVAHFTSWLGRRRDSIVLRSAVAAALEQLEARR